MKLNKILFIRYLLRQRIIIAIISLVVCAITNVTMILASQGASGVWGIILLIIIISIWFFPIYLIIVSIMNYFSFNNELKKIVEEKELFKRMTNELVRELVVKKGIKISIFFDKKSDFDKFNKVIEQELKFQREKIRLLNSNYL